MPAPLLAAAAPGALGVMGEALASTAAAGGAGLFSASNLFPMMMGAGMGLSAMQAFGGGATGFAPQFDIPLSKEGVKLQKTLFEKTKEQYKEGLMPENLASIYMGRIKRQEGAKFRQARGFLTSMTGGVRTGRDISSLVGVAGERMAGLTRPAEWKAAQREEEFRNALTMFQNIKNIEKQTPILRAQAQMYKTLSGAGRRAAQGQALGGMAQMGAYMTLPS